MRTEGQNDEDSEATVIEQPKSKKKGIFDLSPKALKEYNLKVL